MKKILITGNSGYIGSHLSQILKRHNDVILHGLDRNDPQIPLELQYKVDIATDVEWGINTEYDTVIHLAAEVAVGRSVLNPTPYFLSNTMGTLNVLKKIKTRNFIFASTGSAAGLGSPYGISKRMAEDIVNQHCTENDIAFTIFRFYNVIGSDGINPTNPDGLMWNLMNATTSGVFNLFGTDYDTKDGTCVRDYTHVNEICHSVIKGINTSSNQIENLGHGVGTTVQEIVDIFKSVNNVEFDIVPMPRREGDLPISVLSNPSSYMEQLYNISELLLLNK